MKNASDFRQNAREALQGKWKVAIGTGLIASFLGAEIADTAPNGMSELQKVIQSQTGVRNVLAQAILRHGMILPLMILMAWCLMVLLIGGAAQMGYARFHLNLAERKKASFSDLFSQFSRIPDGVAMTIVRAFYLLMWTCLFFILGIIKAYSYAMTPYVLMEHPEYSANEAITESRRLMDGKKWNLLCLNISFLGWRLLCSLQYLIPLFILYNSGKMNGAAVLFLAALMGPLNIGYLFLRPYEEAAFAAFYREVRDEKREAGTEEEIKEEEEARADIEETKAEVAARVKEEA